MGLFTQEYDDIKYKINTCKSNSNISDAGLWHKMAPISYDLFQVCQLIQ